MRRFTLEEIRSMSSAQMRALADVAETLPEERQGEMFAFTIAELVSLVEEKQAETAILREERAVMQAVLESGVKA